MDLDKIANNKAVYLDSQYNTVTYTDTDYNFANVTFALESILCNTIFEKTFRIYRWIILWLNLELPTLFFPRIMSGVINMVKVQE